MRAIRSFFRRAPLMVCTNAEKTCSACFLVIPADSISFATNSPFVIVPPFTVFNTLMVVIQYIQERGKRKVKKSINTGRAHEGRTFFVLAVCFFACYIGINRRERGISKHERHKDTHRRLLRISEAWRRSYFDVHSE